MKNTDVVLAIDGHRVCCIRLLHVRWVSMGGKNTRLHHAVRSRTVLRGVRGCRWLRTCWYDYRAGPVGTRHTAADSTQVYDTTCPRDEGQLSPGVPETEEQPGRGI